MRRVLAVVMVLMMSAVALPSKADVVPTEDFHQVRSELMNLGVSPEVQDHLIAKLEAGQMWDSMLASEHPVSVEQTGGVTREVYADGSLIVTTVEQPQLVTPGTVTPFASVSGCKGTSQISSVKYTGCKVEQNSIFLKMGFYFDYSVPVSGSSVITNAWGWYNTVLMGSSSNNALTRPSSNRAKYSADITSTIGFSWGGTTVGSNSTRNVYLMVIVEGHGANTIVA